MLAVPQFNGLSTLLAGTDIIATVPDYTAEALTAAGGIRAEDPPLDTQTFELRKRRGARANVERWLRSRIQMFFGDPDSLRRHHANAEGQVRSIRDLAARPEHASHCASGANTTPLTHVQ